MKYILDTNIISFLVRGKYPAILEHLRHCSPSNVFIPTVVMAELEFGASNSSNYERTISAIHHYTDAFKKLPFDEAACKIYGQIRLELKSKGQMIGANDLLIAAIAISSDATLITNNTQEFSRIASLTIEDWTE